MAKRKAAPTPVTARFPKGTGRAVARSAGAAGRKAGTAVAIKFPASFYSAAKESADRSHRSVPKQVEYWSEMGRVLDEVGVSKYQLIEASRAILERRRNAPSAAHDLFEELVAFFRSPSPRAQADFLSLIAADRGPVYGTDSNHPGELVEKRPDGSYTVGTIRDGAFVADEVPAERRQHAARPRR